MLPTTRRRRRRLTPLVPYERDRSRGRLPRLRLLVRDRHGCGCGRRRTSAVAAGLYGVGAGLDVEQRAAASGERAREDFGHGRRGEATRGGERVNSVRDGLQARYGLARRSHLENSRERERTTSSDETDGRVNLSEPGRAAQGEFTQER